MHFKPTKLSQSPTVKVGNLLRVADTSGFSGDDARALKESLIAIYQKDPTSTGQIVDRTITLMCRHFNFSARQRLLDSQNLLKPLSQEHKKPFIYSVVGALAIAMADWDLKIGLERLDKVISETNLAGEQIGWLMTVGDGYGYKRSDMMAAIDWGLLVLDYTRYFEMEMEIKYRGKDLRHLDSEMPS